MRVRLSNQQSEVRLRVRPLLRRLKLALTALPRPLPGDLTEITFVLVSRAVMRRVHGEFLDDPTDTDVITFPYGEILICPAVAEEQAAAHGRRLEEEVLLYALHGLLHLAGFEDKTPRKAKVMAKSQEAFLERVLAIS